MRFLLAVIPGLFLTACGPAAAPVGKAPEATSAPIPSPTPEPTPLEPPTPARLEMVVEPMQSIAGRALNPAPAIRVVSEDGRPVPGVEVLVALDGGAFTSNFLNTSSTDANGVAAFPELTIEKAANLLSLVFSASDVPVATSAPFNVRFAPPRALAVTTQPSSSRVSKPIAGPPTVLVADAFGNPVPRIPVVVSLSGSSGSNLGGQTRVSTNESGLAVFHNAIPAKASKNATLAFDAAAAGVPNAVSEPFQIR
jgi:hypothetical protein